MGKKSSRNEITLFSLLFSFLLGKSYMRSKVEEKVIKEGRWAILFMVVAVIILIVLLYFKIPFNINTNLLVSYNALVIAAAVFLLNYHMGELRDVTTSYRNKNTENQKKFLFWTKNKTQDAGIRIVEVKAFFIGVILLAIIFLMISSFIIIASINQNLVALWLSSVSSIGIVAVLTVTFYIYLKAAVNFAKENPYKADK